MNFNYQNFQLSYYDKLTWIELNCLINLKSTTLQTYRGHLISRSLSQSTHQIFLNGFGATQKGN